LQAASDDIKKVYRKARLADIEKWITAVETETSTMFRARGIADGLGLMMKINDVEIQGDNTKAIFYYTAEDRVDFRELIKLLAEEFKVRIEMRQIGARQEASRLGGIGSCGRELCCSTWMSDFKSVTTNAARVQQLSLNPQKLAGQCGKLKCCLNYEYDTYVDALKGIPNTEIRLKTKRGDAFHQKTDIFQRMLWYSYITEPGNLIPIPVDQVNFIMEENKKGNLPEKLEDFTKVVEKKTTFESGAVQDDLTRFDHL
jgi:cell fate regulator YaaT (PSP1 superfamily)